MKLDDHFGLKPDLTHLTQHKEQGQADTRTRPEERQTYSIPANLCSCGRGKANQSTGDEGPDVLDAILRQDHRNAAAMLDALDIQEREAFVQALGKVVLGINAS